MFEKLSEKLFEFNAKLIESRQIDCRNFPEDIQEDIGKLLAKHEENLFKTIHLTLHQFEDALASVKLWALVENKEPCVLRNTSSMRSNDLTDDLIGLLHKELQEKLHFYENHVIHEDEEE